MLSYREHEAPPQKQCGPKLKLTKQADIDEAMAVGARGYLVKPVEHADLIAEVIKLIAEARIAYPVEIVVPCFRTRGFRLM